MRTRVAIPRKHLLRFGEFEIDTDTLELRRAGVSVRLQPQPMKVLSLLVKRAGEILSRQEIERQIWSEQIHVDFEGGLNFCIKQIRNALSDNANIPRYIETLPRQGYRFIAQVQREHQRVQSEARIMLAVLPFGNLTGQSDQEYFTDGLTEELIGQLGRLNPRRLAIIAFTSAKQYRDTAKGIDQIGRELGVDYILEGSVRRAAGRVRIAAQLIEVSDQCHLWAGAYNHTVDDIITLQTEVAQRVAQSLAVELLPDHQKEMARSSTGDADAYEAYLKGRFYWNKRTEDGFFKALRYFQTAIERAPEYTPAYVGIADVYQIAGFYSSIPPKEAYEKSLSAATKALRIDPRFAEALTSMAYGKLLYEWDFEGAEKAFKDALELNPNQVTGHYWYALFLAAMKRFAEAEKHIEMALQFDPLSLVVNSHKGWVLYFARRYDAAIRQLLNTIEMDENFPLARFFLGLVYLQTGQYSEASLQFDRARIAADEHPAAVAGCAAALALCGKKSEALKIVGQLTELAKRRYVIPYYLALAYMALGDVEHTFECLEKACDDRSAYISNLDCDPVVDPLRSHPRFKELMRRVGIPRAAQTLLL